VSGAVAMLTATERRRVNLIATLAALTLPPAVPELVALHRTSTPGPAYANSPWRLQREGWYL
jgi:hypothetical protein